MQSKIVTAASHSCIIEHSANCRIIIAVKKFSTIAACTGRCRGRGRGRGQREWGPSTSSKSCRVEEQTKAGRQHKQWSKHTLPDTERYRQTDICMEITYTHHWNHKPQACCSTLAPRLSCIGAEHYALAVAATNPNIMPKLYN